MITRNRKLVPLNSRKRASAACDRCRIKKIKCVGGVPCEKCVNSSSDCEISSSESFNSNNLDYNEKYKALKSYNTKLERILQFLYPGLELSYLRNSIDTFEKNVCTNTAQVAEGQLFSSSVNDKRNPYSGAKETELQALKNVSTLYVTSTDKSFLEYIERSEISPYVEKFIPRKDNECNDLFVPMSLVEDSLKVLPSDEEILHLVDVFLKVCETNYFYIHPVIFYKELKDYLDMKRSNNIKYLSENWNFLVILLGVLAIASGFDYIAESSSVPDASMNCALHPGFKFYKNALPFVGAIVNSCNPESVQALLLIGVFMTTNKYDDISSMVHQGYIYIYISTELAIANKLHLKETFKDYPLHVQEFYNRIWWTCYCLERLHGIRFGRTEVIKIDEISVGLPADVAALRKKDGSSNYLNQKALIQLTFIFCEIFSSIYNINSVGDTTKLVTLESSVIKSIFIKLESWRDNLPEKCKSYNTNPEDFAYRSNMHLQLYYLLAKIYTGKPFLLYKVENFENLEKKERNEAAFVDHITAICIDAAYCTIETLSMLEQTGKLAIYSKTDLSFCILSLFVIISFTKIDKSPSTLLFLRQGLRILQKLSQGSLSATVILDRLLKCQILTDILEEHQVTLDDNCSGGIYGVNNFIDSFPEEDINIDAATFQLHEGIENLKIPGNLFPSDLFKVDFKDFMGEVDFANFDLANKFSLN